MLKNSLTFLTVLINISIFAQTSLIANQSFESSGDSWSVQFSTPQCTSDGDIWSFQTQIGNITPSDGSQFWGIRDLNGSCGSSEFESIILEEINIIDYRNVLLSFDFNVFEFDNADDIKYEVFFDNNSQGEHLLFEGSGDLSTNGWETETISIPNTVSKIKLIIYIKQNGDNDYAGLDNIKLEGNLITQCSELIISEYIEGTSSSDFRNNYIEIYNPSSEPIDLNNYDLTTFKNSNTQPTGSIDLEGYILPYGTFLIKDDKELFDVDADLASNSTVMDFTGNAKIALRRGDVIIDVLGKIGDSIYFAKDVTLRRKSNIQNPNNEFDESEWDVYGLENIEDLNKHISTCSGNIPEIKIVGNGNEINDGNNSTSTLNNTYFGSLNWNLNQTIEREFQIINTGDAILNVSDIELTGLDITAFEILSAKEFSLSSNESLILNIRFKPKSNGIKTAELLIHNNDASESTFSFIIQGEGTGVSESPLMITQYYEGEGNNRWLEVTNISNTPINQDDYYLALFKENEIIAPVGNAPQTKKGIPTLQPRETIKFVASLNVSLPGYALDNSEIKSNICQFNGNDIIIISTTSDNTCWENKVDIIGENSNWGENKSFVRKYGCDGVLPSLGFDYNDWIILNPSEVDQAPQGSNIRIGEHYYGPTIFDDNSWTNGVPDSLRNVIINDHYDTNINGSFEACNLTISVNEILNVNDNDYVQITDNLNVEGELNIENEGSILMLNNSGLITNSGNTHIFKKTTYLKPFDYTYWSSPVNNAHVDDVFNESPQNSIYTFNTSHYIDNNKDDFDDNDPQAWELTSGLMIPGKGYTAMAPQKEPFVNQQSVMFSGTINNGIIKLPVQRSNQDTVKNNNWNFIGNPYPSALNAESFLSDTINKELLGGSIYLWTHTTSINNNKYSSNDYACYVSGTGGIKASSDGVIPTAYIASCQGFFVEALKQGEIRFTNEMREKVNNNTFFKTNSNKTLSQENKIWINLVNNEGIFSQVLVGFLHGASEKLERKYDAFRLSGNKYMTLYTLLEDKKLAIMGTKPFHENEVIKLGINNQINNLINLKIEIDHREGDLKNQDVFLYDNLLQITHKLNDSPYEFSLTQNGEINNRFEIRFKDIKSITTKIPVIEDKIIVKNYSDKFIISTSANKNIHSVKIYDLMGRLVLEKKINNQNCQIFKKQFLAEGVFMIVVKPENNVFLKEKILVVN